MRKIMESTNTFPITSCPVTSVPPNTVIKLHNTPTASQTDRIEMQMRFVH